MELIDKLRILADAAKYDASCASSGATQRDSLGGKGLGSTGAMGICHSYAPDGRCISLLKLLLTNFCLYDCLYCVNRASSNTRRARFTAEEVVQLTLDFYRRNYIEGLFLSSGIIRSPDYTMEELVRVARLLREDHGFGGYIHLKAIADASQELIVQAARYADRVSVNVELPSTISLKRLAPQKNPTGIKRAMAQLRSHIDAQEPSRRGRELVAPAGQSTQMIVGADTTDDRAIIDLSATLYSSYRLKRVYYSAFSPIPHAAGALPLKAPPLMREHRLYQADWLMRFYGFEPHEITTRGDGMLDLDVDPKLAWALAHREMFPVDLNRADRELLLRVPGLGVRAVKRIITARAVRALRIDDLLTLRVPLKKVAPFVQLNGLRNSASIDSERVARALREPPEQLALL